MKYFILDSGEVVDDKYINNNWPNVIYTLKNIKYNKNTQFIKGKFHEYKLDFYVNENDKCDIIRFKNVVLYGNKKIYHAIQYSLYEKIIWELYHEDNIIIFYTNCIMCNLLYPIIYIGFDKQNEYMFIEPLKTKVFTIPFNKDLIDLGNTPCNEIIIKNILE